MKGTRVFAATVTFLALMCAGCPDGPKNGPPAGVRAVVTSDTILSAMAVSVLPTGRYSVEAILPPGQCPGHYDVKPSDIAKTEKAALTISEKGIPFMDKPEIKGKAGLLVDDGGRNWMAPDSYIYGLGVLAEGLLKHFPEDKAEILARKDEAARLVKTEADSLLKEIRGSRAYGKAVIVSSMQKETIEWMGFRVAGEYGRQEAMSVKEVARLAEAGRREGAVLVVDNLQSGPDTGRGIAEILGVPHVVLTNFPSEKGYVYTLGENVRAVLNATAK